LKRTSRRRRTIARQRAIRRRPITASLAAVQPFGNGLTRLRGFFGALVDQSPDLGEIEKSISVAVGVIDIVQHGEGRAAHLQPDGTLLLDPSQVFDSGDFSLLPGGERRWISAEQPPIWSVT